MPTPTIPAGNLFMNATTYTGTGATQVITNGVTGQSFQPDFVWFKTRNAVNENVWIDSVRGVNQDLYSSLTSAENTVTDRLLSFNSNGVTVGVDAGRGVNYAGQTQVAWQWKAGGTAVSNTSGSITSSVSANTTSGFSVVTYTGASGGAASTVGHGLGVAPSMIIVKNRSGAFFWSVYHASLGATQYLQLSSTNAAATDSGQWNNTAPTSTVFSEGGSNNTGAASNNYVAYCWTPIAGYSAFGSYTGNGSTDGPFVYTGFRPRWILIKRTDAINNWFIFDTARDTYNSMADVLEPNLSNAEGTTNCPIDCLSNGWKTRGTAAEGNFSGGTYIYAAFAEVPFKYANAR